MAESAAQLFARLGAKEQLGDLGLPFFSYLPGQRLKPGDVVELCGNEGSGKTEILLNVTARCVLPKLWKDTILPGRNVEVVYISTDYKLDLLRLVAILEGEVGKVCDAENRKDTTEHLKSKNEKATSEYRKLIELCLSRVHVLYCNSSTELVTVLHSLKTFLRNHSDVCVLILDNIASYYWVDRSESGRAGTTAASQYRQQQWVSALGELNQEYHLVVFAAKPLLFTKSVLREEDTSEKEPEGKTINRLGSNFNKVPGAEEFMCKQWQRLVKYRFYLQKLSRTPQQLASVTISPSTSTHKQHKQTTVLPTFSAHLIHPPGAVWRFLVHQDGIEFIR